MGLLDPNLFSNPVLLNQLKGLLGNMPIAQLMRGEAEVSREGLLGEMRKIPVFGPSVSDEFMNNAMNAITPMGFMGAIIPGAGWAGKAAPSVEKLAKNKGKFLYHSGDAKNIDSLKYGIEPTNTGPWVSEVAAGAVDDAAELLANSTPLAWFSDEPIWAGAIAARASGKQPSQATIQDIVDRGHLAIVNKKDPSAKNLYRVGEDGLSDGAYSIVENTLGKQMKAYETPIYGEGNYGQRIEPFGVERNEWISTDSVDPMVHLTGDDLIRFLELSGFLSRNIGRTGGK